METEATVKEKEALETGMEAYIYAYPLVMMGQTLRVSTNVATPEGTNAPMDQFADVRQYPPPEYRKSWLRTRIHSTASCG
jgi:hypothetical protein